MSRLSSRLQEVAAQCGRQRTVTSGDGVRGELLGVVGWGLLPQKPAPETMTRLQSIFRHLRSHQSSALPGSLLWGRLCMRYPFCTPSKHWDWPGQPGRSEGSGPHPEASQAQLGPTAPIPELSG